MPHIAQLTLAATVALATTMALPLSSAEAKLAPQTKVERKVVRAMQKLFPGKFEWNVRLDREGQYISHHQSSGSGSQTTVSLRDLGKGQFEFHAHTTERSEGGAWIHGVKGMVAEKGGVRLYAPSSLQTMPAQKLAHVPQRMFILPHGSNAEMVTHEVPEAFRTENVVRREAK
jgi:hypothetical protein